MNKVAVHHFHDGNDPNHTVRGYKPGHCAKYATVAYVVNLDTGERLAEQWSYCNPHDNPSRKIGRLKAVKKLQGRFPELVRDSVYSPGLEYLK